MLRFLSMLVVVAGAAIAVFAQDSKPADKPDEKAEDKAKTPSVTHHEVTIGGTAIKYTATAGYMDLPDYDGKVKANVFYIAYVRDDAAPPAEGTSSPADPAKRPILFAFNGGPGSSSVWLHLGTIGPRRVDMGPKEDPPEQPAPPYRLVDNEESWLDLADLVFIDPVSTGYSRPVEGENKSQFHGLEEDIRAVGEFIRLYTTKNRRWASPKFLAGESYGTTRAAGLSNFLQGDLGMYLNGIILISPVLNFQTIDDNGGNDTPYWLFLPTYTATAWYHKKLDAELQRDLKATVAQAEKWASSEYLVALAKGDGLTPAELDAAATQLARFSGLSKQFVLNARLRVGEFEFMKELLRAEGKTVARLDSRYTGIDARNVGNGPEFDASYAAIQGPYTAMLNDYVRSELKYENDRVYEILTGRVHPWSYAGATNRYVNVGERLRSAMTENPSLKVYIAAGYYDLATPFYAAAYTANHLGLDPSLRGHLTMGVYEGGHMMYIRTPDLAKLKGDVANFMDTALPAGR